MPDDFIHVENKETKQGNGLSSENKLLALFPTEVRLPSLGRNAM